MKNLLFVVPIFIFFSCNRNNFSKQEFEVNSIELAIDSTKENSDDIFCLQDTIKWTVRASRSMEGSNYVDFNVPPNCILENAFHGSHIHIDFLVNYLSIVDHHTINIFNQIERNKNSPIWRFRGKRIFESLLYRWANFHDCENNKFVPCSSTFYLNLLLDMIETIDGENSFYQVIETLQSEFREGLDCECKPWKLTEDYLRMKYENGEIVFKDFGKL